MTTPATEKREELLISKMIIKNYLEILQENRFNLLNQGSDNQGSDNQGQIKSTYRKFYQGSNK